MEKYSVLMSVYNKVKPDELELSVSSIVNQTVPPDEFVIVWDGPVGEELKLIVDRYSKKHPDMFTLVQLPKNHGLAYALNVGIEASRNEMIARMDADDISLPERCELQLQEFDRNPNLALVGAITRRFTNSPEDAVDLVQKRPTNMAEIKENLRRNNPFAHPLVMYRKSAVLACGGYDDKLIRRQDYDLFSKMIYHGYECMNLDKVLLLFREDDNFMQRNRNKLSCDMRIEVQRRVLRRKQCTVGDFLYIWFAMRIAQILPLNIYNFVFTKIKKSKA